MRVAIYTRVSKSNGQQTVARQTNELKKFCEDNGWKIVEEVKEQVSGLKTKRSGTQKLINLARGNHIQKVVVHEVSRLGRNLIDVAEIVEDLADERCSVYDFKTKMETLDVNNNKTIFFHIILPIFAGIAQQWTDDHSYRIKSGIEEAKRQGRYIGRPKVDKFKCEDEIVELLQSGLSIRKTAAKLGISDKTVKKVKNKRRSEIEQVSNGV